MTHWYLFCKTELLIERLPDGTYTIPSGEEPPVPLKQWQTIHHVTPNDDGDIEVRTVLLDAPPSFPTHPSSLSPHHSSLIPHPSYEMCGLRASYYKLPHALYLKAGKCQELLYWDQNTKFCGVCGAPMKLHTDISKRCTNCGKEEWPQVSPAVIVLIHRPATDEHGAAITDADGNPVEEVLLVQARNFRTDFYGLVAGFVETGETLEEAVHREVMEETGLTITNLRYFGSQPWPYPCGLMVGFHADYVAGDIHLQRAELKKGAWFRRDHLPTIPEKLSIARQLIDDWLKHL